jgi:hypothetical protein
LTTITWEKEGFALAEGYDEASGRYAGLVLPGGDARFGSLVDSTLLVMPEAALLQELEAGERPSTEPGQAVAAGVALPQVSVQPPPMPRARRYFGVYTVDPNLFGRSLNQLSQEILQPLTSIAGVQVRISVEIHAEHPDGFPDDKVRIIEENAATLRFDQSAFEDG